MFCLLNRVLLFLEELETKGIKSEMPPMWL